MITEATFLITIFLILFSVGIYLTYLSVKAEKKGCYYWQPSDAIFSWILGLIISFFLSMLVLLGIFQFFRWLDADVSQTYKQTVTITSIKNSNNVSGSFMLGCGNIESVEYYYYYKFNGEGYIRGKKRVENTTIIERENETPHVEVLVNQYKSKSGLIRNYTDEQEESYRIIVPKGTVLSKFEVY